MAQTVALLRFLQIMLNLTALQPFRPMVPTALEALYLLMFHKIQLLSIVVCMQTVQRMAAASESSLVRVI